MIWLNLACWYARNDHLAFDQLMICRPYENGWLFISQPAHAWMAGELAAAWGNDSFAQPNPREAVILATRLHDTGWSNWDVNPRLGGDGRPVNFLETNLEETTPIWRNAVQKVRMMDPYAALLVSMHASTIYGRRLQRGVDPPQKQPEVHQALREHEQIQANLRQLLVGHPIYGEACRKEQLVSSYRWLRSCDLLSLAVLAEVLPENGKIENVPLGIVDSYTTISYLYRSPLTLEINPWPFAMRELQLHVEARYVNQETFKNQRTYHLKLSSATWHPLVATIRPQQ